MDARTARNHLPITKSDATTIYADALYVGVAGDVTCIDKDGTSATYTCVAGTIIPTVVSKVMATGTTASGIVGLIY